MSPAPDRRPVFREGYIPSPTREWLLKAALDPGPAARDAWHRWREAGPAALADPACARLLPLMHPRLSAWGVHDPGAEAARQAYHHTRVRNRVHFRRCGEILRDLNGAGIETLVLKGPALTLLHYGDPAQRPMSDFDLLVRRGQAAAAAAHLARLGWSGLPPDGLPMPLLALRHALELRSPAGEPLDLHWNALAVDDAPGADDDLWAAAVPLALDGTPTLALDPAGQILHACVHGARWNPVPPVRWVADAAVVVRSAGDRIDWDRLERLARSLRLTLPLRVTLGYLRDRMGVPLPAGLPERLSAVRPTWGERAEHRFWSVPPHRRTGWTRLAGHWTWYRRLCRKNPGALGGFLSFLRRNWDVEHWWELPAAAVATRRPGGDDAL